MSPGTAVPPIYSNSAFAVLTSIVEKASQLTFIEYLRRNILLPLGIDDVRVGATAANGRFPNEVSTYDAVGFGPSQLDMAANATEPNAYGEQVTFENGCDGEGALVTSSGMSPGSYPPTPSGTSVPANRAPDTGILPEQGQWR